MIRILVADDHSLLRDGLRSLIAAEDGMTVVGEAATGREAVEAAAETSPDVILLDVGMPGRGAIETLRDLQQRAPNSRVLMLTAQPEDSFAVRYLREGAAGYLTKDQAADQLVRVIRKVASGGRYISENLAERIAHSVGPAADLEPHERLSGREYQVLLLIAQSKTPSEIADELCLSVKTVSTYRSRILEKMGLENNSELMLYVLRAGLHGNSYGPA